MSDCSRLDIDVTDGLLTLCLRKPPVNVLNIALLGELDRALEVAAQETSVRVLLLTGQEGAFFSAGVDVADHTEDRVVEMLSIFHRVIRRLRDFPVPTVAALNGSALGGGLELALACDMRVAVEGIRLGQPEICLGVFAPVAAILLPRLLPPAWAHEMLMAGTTLDVTDALRYGLLNRVFASEDYAEGVDAYLRPLLGCSRAAQLENKRALREAESRPFDEALHLLERRYLREGMATVDAREGIAAFLEKRAPRWSHR